MGGWWTLDAPPFQYLRLPTYKRSQPVTGERRQEDVSEQNADEEEGKDLPIDIFIKLAQGNISLTHFLSWLLSIRRYFHLQKILPLPLTSGPTYH